MIECIPAAASRFASRNLCEFSDHDVPPDSEHSTMKAGHWMSFPDARWPRWPSVRRRAPGRRQPPTGSPFHGSRGACRLPARVRFLPPSRGRGSRQWMRRRAAETGQHVGKRAASAGRSSLSASCCPASWQTTRKPSGSERKSEPPWKQSTETSSLKWEQLGGFCRAKEEFNGVDVVVSYLINKGDNYENHDNSTSNCVDPPEYVRPCARWDEHGKSRHSPLQHGRCDRSYRNQTQECFWEYASSHRA